MTQEVMVDEPGTGFGEWVTSRGPSLQRFAYLVTGDAHRAAGLVQDALERALPRWRRLVRAGTAEAYVRRSIVNASVSGWRKDRRLVVVEDTEPHLRAHHPDPAVELGDADHAWALVSGLPPAQRAAVVLRFYEDLAFEEIGEVLGCPASTARWPGAAVQRQGGGDGRLPPLGILRPSPYTASLET